MFECDEPPAACRLIKKGIRTLASMAARRMGLVEEADFRTHVHVLDRAYATLHALEKKVDDLEKACHNREPL